MSVLPPVSAESIPPTEGSIYPTEFADRTAGRTKRKLGDHFGLRNFGINLTRLAPGAISALAHHHATQDELVYVLEGNPTLLLDGEPHRLQPGDCHGIRAGSGVAVQLINETDQDVVYLEVGDRSRGDRAVYPDEDLLAVMDENGRYRFLHKDGTPY